MVFLLRETAAELFDSLPPGRTSVVHLCSVFSYIWFVGLTEITSDVTSGTCMWRIVLDKAVTFGYDGLHDS